jgi:hypothetical protein
MYAPIEGTGTDASSDVTITSAPRPCSRNVGRIDRATFAVPRIALSTTRSSTAGGTCSIVPYAITFAAWTTTSAPPKAVTARSTLHLVLLEYVGRQCQRGSCPLVVALAPGLREPLLPAGRKHDPGTLSRERSGAGPPDAARSSEHDDDALVAIAPVGGCRGGGRTGGGGHGVPASQPGGRDRGAPTAENGTATAEGGGKRGTCGDAATVGA